MTCLCVGLVVCLIWTVSAAPLTTDQVENVEASSVSAVGTESFIPNTATWINNGRRYYVKTDKPLTLNDAKIACERLSPTTKLVSIETQSELTYLRNKLAAFVPPLLITLRQAQFWTAATDLIIHSTRGEGQYWFYYGFPVDVTFWNVGEPNDFGSSLGRKPETCVDIKVPTLNLHAGFALNDELCTEELSYICETPL